MLALISAQNEALEQVAGLPLAVRNIIAAHKYGLGRDNNGLIIILALRDSLAGRTITAALAKTTLNIEPIWVGPEDQEAFEQRPGDETAVFIGPGALVAAPAFFAAMEDTAPFPATAVIRAGEDAVASVGPLQDYLQKYFKERREPDLSEPALRRLEAGSQHLLRVRSREEFALAQKRLFTLSGKQSDGFISRHLNRPISQRISRWMARTPLRPIHLTGLTAIFLVASFAALMTGVSAGLVVGCILFHVASVIDGVDGEIARVKFMTSRRGAAIDTAVDMIGNFLFFIGLSYALYALHGSPYHILGAAIVVTAAICIILLSVLPRAGAGGGSFDGFGLAVRARIKGRIMSKIFEVFGNILRRDFFAFGAAVLALAGLAFIIPWIIAVGMGFWLGAIIANSRLLRRAAPQDITPPHLREPF